MLKRIAELEAEVKDLKAAKTGQVVSDNAATKPIEPQDVSPAPSPNITVSNPQILEAQRGMQFRGFGDVDLQGGNSGQSNGFQLGIFNLLMTSRLSENVGFLGELVMDVSSAGMFRVEPERALLMYRPNDYFHASLGRYHTGIGYYNNAYHHGAAFLQTATGRPPAFRL